MLHGGWRRIPACAQQDDPACEDPAELCLWTDGIADGTPPAGWCSKPCNAVGDCAPPPDGDAMVACTYYGTDLPLRCMVRCENGETCPTGMTCLEYMTVPEVDGYYAFVCALDRDRRHARSPARDLGLGADALRRLEREAHASIEHRSDRTAPARAIERVLHLSEDLRLADDHAPVILDERAVLTDDRAPNSHRGSPALRRLALQNA